ncbi:molybdopterin cofactor-binding domain-containing protein [Spirochaetia bacterium 38H-sp]|uniref:Molybdopterin cofactor-binding domain-containing protein n=1 Tax=Rarispira pelagica TaxID=3141764 RepID=A0ABU9UBC2_9SPIR
MLNSVRKILTGSVLTPADVVLPDMLDIVLLRSSRRHAEIEEIIFPTHPDPDVVVLGASDIPSDSTVILEQSIPLLAKNKVFYQGQPILLAYSRDRNRAKEEISKIRVKYKELPAVLSIDNPSGNQIENVRTITRGKPGDTIDGKKIEGKVFISQETKPPVDADCSVVYLHNDTVNIITDCPWPALLRTAVAKACKIKENSIIIHQYSRENAYDADILSPIMASVYAAVIAIGTNQPARIFIPPIESSLYGSKSPAISFCYKAIINQNTIKELSVTASINTGYIAPFSREMVERCISLIVSRYRCKNMTITARTVRTNITPTGFFAGLIDSQLSSALETMIDSIAKKANLDPYELRLSLLTATGKKTHPAKATLEIIRKNTDFARKIYAYNYNKEHGYVRKGIGLSLASSWHGFITIPPKLKKYTLSLLMDVDGTIILETPYVPGDKLLPMEWKKTISTMLNTPIEKIKLHTTFEGSSSSCAPSFMGNNIAGITPLIEKICKKTQKQRFRTPLPIAVRITQSEKTDYTGPLGYIIPPVKTSWASCVAEVSKKETDMYPQIEKISIVIDAGKIINKRQLKKIIRQNSILALKQSISKNKDLSSNPESYLFAEEAFINTEIDIKFVASNRITPLPAANLPFSLIPSAITIALSQLYNKDISTIPVITGEEE